MSLLVLNIERFLAIAYPFFHQSIVTKERVFSCQVAIILFVIVVQAAAANYKIGPALMTVILPFLVCFFALLNYNMFTIAKSKQANEIIVLGPQASVHARNKTHFAGFQHIHISTCTLAVVCTFICSCAPIVYLGLRWKWETPYYGKQFSSLALWATTSVSMSSTFNCLIFFWRNTVLRREAMKIMKCSHFI
jgi:hypothetical protein